MPDQISLFHTDSSPHDRDAGLARAVGAEASWLLEDNTLIVKPLRAAGAVDRMRWRIYDRSIGG